MLILGSLYTLCQVAVIAGVVYGVEQWGGKWDGMVGVANSYNWHLAVLFKVVLATMCLGL